MNGYIHKHRYERVSRTLSNPGSGEHAYAWLDVMIDEVASRRLGNPWPSSSAPGAQHFCVPQDTQRFWTSNQWSGLSFKDSQACRGCYSFVTTGTAQLNPGGFLRQMQRVRLGMSAYASVAEHERSSISSVFTLLGADAVHEPVHALTNEPASQSRCSSTSAPKFALSPCAQRAWNLGASFLAF